jgi:hypothetical protein
VNDQTNFHAKMAEVIRIEANSIHHRYERPKTKYVWHKWLNKVGIRSVPAHKFLEDLNGDAIKGEFFVYQDPFYGSNGLASLGYSVGIQRVLVVSRELALKIIALGLPVRIKEMKCRMPKDWRPEE